MSQPSFVSPRVLAERAYRARRISQTFGRVYLGTKATQWIEGHLRPPDMERRWARLHRDNARAVYDAAVDLRGLILKGCQFLGARADVLPDEWVERLGALQDRVPAHPFPVVRRTVERELRAPLESLFASFSREPIASASLAQVHEATLRNGRHVAVKVQYPEIRKLVHGDLANLRFLFRAVGLLERDFDPMPLIDELGTYVPLELDFENEGRNAEIVAGHFAHRDDIAVPEIVWDLTTRRVLVMEFQSGIKIDDVSGLRAAGVDPARVGELLTEAFCEQILVHGFFHADPHPGNLLVDPDGPRLVMLDFGLTKDLPERFREGILGFVASLVQGDVDAMGRALRDLGFEMREGGEEALREVASVLLRVGQEVRERGRLDPESVARLRDEIPATLRRNSLVRVPHHLVLLGRAIGLLSGVTTALGARIDWIRTVMPYAFASRS
ncbi:MAG: AarF/ABC1/UbiB kinase family protein [Myxococcota bacterium]|nr:AarF/ABC1/UbiB kinase family protein [Myxococcota bacterium]